jgi:hypothetical protein
MCAYKYIRLAKQKEQSYSLDSILNKELGIRKLKFKEADGYTGLQWHQVMQRDYKLEYIVYNMFDCISMLELDEKTKDLGYTLPTYAGLSDFSIFNSQPKRIGVSYYFHLLKKENHILGTVGSAESEEELAERMSVMPTYESLDNSDSNNIYDDVLDLKQWIVTLPAHLNMGGVRCIEEDPNAVTMIRPYTFDSDMVGAYPSVTEVCNVSKATTKREIIDMGDIPEDVFRIQNLNIVFGPTNAIEYCRNMFNLPGPLELMALMD